MGSAQSKSPGHAVAEQREVRERRDDERKNRAREAADEGDEEAEAGHERRRCRDAEHECHATDAEDHPSPRGLHLLPKPALRTGGRVVQSLSGSSCRESLTRKRVGRDLIPRHILWKPTSCAKVGFHLYGSPLFEWQARAQ